MDQLNQPDTGMPSTVPEAISRAFKAELQLHVNREDTAFIAGICTYLDLQQNYSLEFADLEKVYNIVNELSHGNLESVSQRVQNAIERLLKNQLLIRVDGGGISFRPIYDVTRLGKAIVDFLTNNEKLTRQNLTIITSRIVAFIADIRRSMETGGSDKFWEDKVHLPLRHVITELIEAIEKRQRGLDIEQEDVRSQISSLLEKDWLDALETCESLLDTTSETLQELYRTLLAENTAMKQGLNDIYEQADNNQQNAVLETIENIYRRLDQLEQWGKERVSSWSQYYRRVNDFLQSIVRFDPNREYSQKLKEQLLAYPQTPWFLDVIDAPVYRTIREINLLSSKKSKVVRTLRDLSQDDMDSDDDGNLVLDLMIEELKKRLKTGQELDLIDVIRPFLEQHPLENVYPHIGTLIDLLLKESDHHPGRCQKWEKPLEQLELELQNLIVQKTTEKI